MSTTPQTSVEVTGADGAQELLSRLSSISAERVTFNEPVRLSMRISSVDLLDWLDAQEVITKFYWRSRSKDIEYAAITLPRFGLNVPTVRMGMLPQFEITEPPSDDTDAPPTARAFNSFGFLGNDRFEPAASFSTTPRSFVLPDIEMITDRHCTWLECQLAHGGDIEILREGLSSLSWDYVDNTALPPLIDRIEVQSRLEWAVAVNRAIAAIGRDELSKIVLARQVRYRFAEKPSPWQILKRLRERNSDSYLFGFDRRSHDPFVGASPERLYKRIGNRIETEAVAGTRPRGKTAEEDARYRDDLLHSSKDRTEHELVVRGIAESLKPLASRITAGSSPTVVQLSQVQHLVIQIEADLRPGITDDDILRALQPTPAVGGYPRTNALELIPVLESFDRGPYAGPIGWMSPNEAEFAVGIRSAVIRNEKLLLTAGAGIVRGSDPNAEWEEIDQKFNTFASILNAQ